MLTVKKIETEYSPKVFMVIDTEADEYQAKIDEVCKGLRDRQQAEKYSGETFALVAIENELKRGREALSADLKEFFPVPFSYRGYKFDISNPGLLSRRPGHVKELADAIKAEIDKHCDA